MYSVYCKLTVSIITVAIHKILDRAKDPDIQCTVNEYFNSNECTVGVKKNGDVFVPFRPV